MDCIVHGVAKSQTQLSNFHFGTRSNISGLRGWFFGVFFFFEMFIEMLTFKETMTIEYLKYVSKIENV